MFDFGPQTYWARLVAASCNLAMVSFACVGGLGSNPQFTQRVVLELTIAVISPIWLVIGVVLLGRSEKRDLTSTLTTVCGVATASGLALCVWAFLGIANGSPRSLSVNNNSFLFVVGLMAQFPCAMVTLVAGFQEWLRRNAAAREAELREHSGD